MQGILQAETTDTRIEFDHPFDQVIPKPFCAASPYDYLRVNRQFMRPADRRGDPLLLRYFDELTSTFIAESEKLQGLYHVECGKTGLTICDTARTRR